MAGIFSPAQLSRELERLGSGECLADPLNLLADALSRFRPPEKISTLDWAEKNRKFRLPDSGALVPYDRWRTPYNIAASDALDEPGVELVVMVKPSRSGGTTIAENFVAKMIDIGPMGRVAWYLGSDKAVKEYAEGAIRPLFEDHPRLQAKVGKGRSDDSDTRKRVSGYLIEFLAANASSFTNREFYFGVMDEPDAWTRFGESPKTQLKGRQKNVGRRRKGMILSHPDKGWRAGTAAAWETTSRGIYIMRCAECLRFAAAHATKFWPDVPQFTLDYQRAPKGSSVDRRMEIAGRKAGMACPHCGVVLSDEQRFAMVDEAGANGWWMHRGQHLDVYEGIQGTSDPHTDRGFWVHGLMIKTSPAVELAKGLEEALAKFERSGGSKTAGKALREFMSKQLGEIFEGKADIEGVSAASLNRRADKQDLPRGLFPAEALFITAAVDVGQAKFDVSFRAWDSENRSWWLDRTTILQRTVDGISREIRTRERIDDWMDTLIDQVLLRRFPVDGYEDELAMPVAAVAIDVSDGNVTWMGREFARRCLKRGLFWGSPSQPWSRVKLIQGSPNPKAAPLPDKPTRITKDEKGKPIKPEVQEWTLGAHQLKELALERLAVTDGGPGQCHFAAGIAADYYEEYFNEPLVDGRFVRQGPNESLDLFGYEEAVRLMLKPDRKDLWLGDVRPPWARPISLTKGGDPSGSRGEPTEAEPKRESIFERYKRMNRRPTGNGRD